MKKQNNRCNYRDWPIRRQLMFSFLCTTIFLQMILLIVIFVNLEIMITQTDNQVSEKVTNQSSIEFNRLGDQIGLSFQSHAYLLASQLGVMEQFFFEFQDPINDYQVLSSYQLCRTQDVETYSYGCFYVPDNAQQIYNLNTPTSNLIGKIENYNTILQYVFTPYLRNQIHRFSILITEPSLNTAIYYIYPAINITNYEFNSIIQNYTQLSGPYLDGNQMIMALTKYTKFNQFNLFFNLEFTTISLKLLFSEINYYEQTFVVLTDNSGTLIYAPDNWNSLYQQQQSKIFDYEYYSGFNKLNIPNKFQSNLIINSTEYVLVKLPFSGTYESYQLSSFIANRINTTDFYVYLYTPLSSMISTYTIISDIVTREEISIILLTLCSSTFTLAIVFIFTYLIAVRISRPLNKLITTAAFMSNNVTKKNITSEILHELNEIQAENQIADLIQAFKNLVKTIDEKNKSKHSTVKRTIVQYPLNQYDPEFINKTKNKSDINWHNLINEIEDE